MAEQEIAIYRKLILGFPLPSLLVHLRTELIDTANSLFTELTGISRSKMENTFLNNIGFSNLTVRMLLQAKRFNESEEEHTTVNLADNSGETRNLLSIKRDIKFGGELYRLLIFINFTEFHAQLNRSHSNEEKYRKIFEVSPVLYMITRARDGVVLEVNGSYANLLKREKEDIIGKKTPELVSGWKPEMRQEIADRISRYGFIHNFETTFTDRLNEKHTVLTSVHSMMSDNEQCHLICAVDITLLKKTESDLQMAKLSLDTAAELIFWIDENGFPRYVNQTACEVLGYAERELREISVIDLDLTLTEKEFQEITRKSNSEAVLKETSLLKKDGTMLPVDIAIKIFKHMDQSILSYTARDISLRKVEEEKKAETQRQIAGINSAKDKIFSIIGHDLRGPLNGILSLTEFLINPHKSLSQVEVRGYGEHIHNAAAEGYHLLEDLLLWAQLQTGSEKIHPVGVPVRDLALETADLYRLIMEKKKIHFITEIDKELMVRADKRLLKTIFRNLLLNALKFVSDSGTVKISAETMGKNAKLSFENDGAGLSKDIIERILEKSNAAEFKGTGTGKKVGFGLFISREMADLSGTKLSISSSHEKGTVLSLVFPQVVEKKATPRP